MQVILNEHGYVENYALIGTFGSHSVTVSEPENLDDFEKNYRSYYLSDGGNLVNDFDQQAEIEDEFVLKELRAQREKICFTYIKRGELWYGKLSAEQKEQLNAWYDAWLDVTNTRVIPKMPNWLN